MAPFLQYASSTLFARGSDTETPQQALDNNKKLTPTLIIGIVVAVILVLGLGIWFGIHQLRKKKSEEREDDRGAAFLNVKGLVDEKRCV